MRNGEFPLTWYPIGWSKDIKSHPVRRELLGNSYVLFRGAAGEVCCVEAFCPHRGTDLSLGKCSGGKLQCAYHGWEFDATGKCIKIPARPNKTPPARANLSAYPSIERDGLVWIYPVGGSAKESLPALPSFPELTDRAFRYVPSQVEWKTHLTRTIESIIDTTHLPFVHTKTFGSYCPVAPHISSKVDGDRYLFRVSDSPGIDTKVTTSEIEYTFPQQMMLRRSWGGDRIFLNYYAFAPMDRERCIIYCLTGRNFMRSVPFMDQFFRLFNEKVFGEDKAIVEAQRPTCIPDKMGTEMHIELDEPAILFRKRWYKFLEDERERRVYAKGEPEAKHLVVLAGEGEPEGRTGSVT